MSWSDQDRLNLKIWTAETLPVKSSSCVSQPVICHRTKFTVKHLSQPDSATPVRKWILPSYFIFSPSFKQSSWSLSAFPQREWSHPLTQTFFLSFYPLLLLSSEQNSWFSSFNLCCCYCSSTPPGTHCEETNSPLCCSYTSLLPLWSVRG